MSQSSEVPPWERTGTTARQRLTELAERCEANGLAVLPTYYGPGMATTGGTMYPLPVTDLRALLDEVRPCRCCADNECQEG